MTPHDAIEWLEAISIGADIRSADFAAELLGIVTGDMTDNYHNMVADLEKAAGQSFNDDWQLSESFIDRHHLLAELADTLDKAGFKGDPDEALSNLLCELYELRAQVDGLEYELRHCASERDE